MSLCLRAVVRAVHNNGSVCVVKNGVNVGMQMGMGSVMRTRIGMGMGIARTSIRSFATFFKHTSPHFPRTSPHVLRSSAVTFGAVAATALALTAALKSDPAPIETVDPEQRVVTADELSRHVTRDSLWVYYDGYVYDVTPLLGNHPGGDEALLSAGGLSIDQFWEKYQIHFTANAIAKLLPLRVGKMSDVEAQKLQHIHHTTAQYARAQQRSSDRTWKVICVAAAGPFLGIVCSLLRAIAYFGYYLGGASFAAAVERHIPMAVPGIGGASLLSAHGPTKGKVAVVGGGISGVGCAYSLQRSGYDVTIYESRSQLGGNAQTAMFPIEGKGEVRHDLGVLFWAPEYYKNYMQLLHQLNVKCENVSVRYLLHTRARKKEGEYYAPPDGPNGVSHLMQPSLQSDFEEDFKKYDRMVAAVTSVNNFFTGDTSPSFYKSFSFFAKLNPCNYIGIRQMSRVFGISNEFYTNVLRPFHGIQFSTLYIDDIPAYALAVLDAIVPLTSTRQHTSWGVGNSTEVFEAASKNCRVKLNARITDVIRGDNGVTIKGDGFAETYDRVVFACNAHATANILRNQTWLESWIIGGVQYNDEITRPDWRDWLEAPVHTDQSILPRTSHLEDVIQSNYAFFIDVDENGAVEYDHLLGSWSPAAIQKGAKGAPMFVTQCMHPSKTIDPAKVINTFSAPRGHPCLSVQNMVVTQLLPLIQGKGGVYYCSNYTAPGNGHDLSLTSGLVAACAVGAMYPFTDDRATHDFKQMANFMGLNVNHAFGKTL